MIGKPVQMMLLAAAVMTAPAAELTQTEREAFLRNARFVSTKTLGMGVTQSRKAVMEDGTIQHAAHIQSINEAKASFQTVRGTELNFRDSYKYNVAAYELAKLIGLDYMVPPSVERKAPGGMGAVTWWVDDVAFTDLERRKQKVEPPDMNKWNKQMNIVHVFDQLIYNTDRNLGNLLITKDWKLWMIDHTRAFRTFRHCPDMRMLRQIDSELLTRIRNLDGATVVQVLKPYLTKMEIDGLLARKDAIVGFFDKQIAAQGQAAVVYEWARL
ncbi:MAG TPA: hypothetical protein VFL57_19270 [Bryobacteraceae bacterium]|nr:hypothetical protein [Bryobacteraceae bacterium]